ncbi:CHAD domain-containing protein [Anaerolineae bacterium CFX9]|nr:CHAD domain-containing protein [Anaerolineae bacterium CFX9]
MATDALHEDLITRLSEQIQPVSADDTMAEAGRKILLGQFVEMLSHEAGSRAGEDPEAVHDMRVATRRMRSTLALLESYYKAKSIRGYALELRRIARALGGVRDLDVLIADVKRYQATLDKQTQADLQPILDVLNAERDAARKTLLRVLDKGDYRRFIADFATFLTRSGAGAKPLDNEDVQPSKVRHILPAILYSHLGQVRAYDAVLADADEMALHALRIEFKRLRYAVSLFSDVLGSQVKDFIEELKAVQDHLGRIQDIATAHAVLGEIADTLDGAAAQAIQRYLDQLAEESDTLQASFPELWRRFNLKTVQKQLASAVTAL